MIFRSSVNPNLSTKELGGTGRIHNWEISEQIVKNVKIPVYLAGGLNPNNSPKLLFEGIIICGV